MLLLLGASLVLIKAVDYFVKSVTKLSHALKISSYTVSFLLVAIATSLPEAFVGITAALEQESVLSYGNVLGSNIALLTLIVALPSLLNSKLKTESIFKSKDIYYTILFVLVSLVLSFDGTLGKRDGMLLLVGYAVYTIAFIRRSSRIEQLLESFERRNVAKQLLIFFVSLLVILIASEGIVRGAINLSTLLKLEIGFIGLTITAIGTSLPEIAFAIASVRNHHEKDVMGDVVGSVVANTTLVLGITAVIFPINTSDPDLSVSSNIFLLIALLLFYIFTRSKGNLDKKESVALLALYFIFVLFEYYTQF